MKKSNCIAKVGIFFLKLKEVVDYAAIICVFYILLYQIEALRSLCKAICEYAIEWFLPVKLSGIKALYFMLEKGFRVVIVLSIFAAILSAIVRNINEKRMKNKCGENRFEKSLFRYLHDTAVPRCFFVTGQWGTGKSFEVNLFFDNYYKYTKTQVYRVSCFGLSSRKELIDEINNIVEQSDNSFYAQIIKVLQYLPVIGEAINKFLKKSYAYDSINKGSVFIFEDFERITSRTITNEYSGTLYEQSHSFRSGIVRQGQYKEFEEIKKEFDAVGKAFARVDDFVTKSSLREDYDKYVAIVGFINELIEVYGMKVIVVCNTDVLGEKFIHDILRSKLNCLEYKKVITPETKVAIIESIIESKTFDDAEKQRCITDYLNFIKENIESFELDVKFKDMRLFGGLLEAFIDTAMLFDKDILTEEFLNSLLNSIMIMHLGYYNNAIRNLNAYVNGADIEFLVRLFGGPIDATNLIRKNNCAETMRWIDARISGYWILNLSVPEDIKEISKEWKNYKYFALERRVFSNPQVLMQENDYNILHVFYYQKEIDKDNAGEWEYRTYIENALAGYDLGNIEVIEGILDAMYQIFGGRFYQNFQEALFEIIAGGKADGKLKGNTFIHKRYIEFLEKRLIATK